MVFSRWRLPLVLAAACLVQGIALGDDDILEGKDDLAGSGVHDYDHGSGSGESSGEGEPDQYHDDHDLPTNLSAEAPVSGWAYGCPYPTSGGDFDAGIQLVGDATCNQGGLGCYADVCRFCKFRETDKSSHLVTCDSLGYDIHVPVVVTQLPPPNPDTDCPYIVSSGDFAAGVQLVGDPSCVNGGIGCYQDVCRFCKFRETPQSTNWRNCSDFGYPHTPAPTFAPLEIDDLDGGVWDGSTGCAYAVSSGDFAVGVQLVGDASCATGGIGCFGTDCRFCQFRPTLQSKHMLTCSSLGYPRPAQPIAAPTDITDPITGCPFPVPPGDFAAGVQLVGDPTCAKGGLGCFKDVCRFCKFKESPQSTNFVPCSDFNYPPEAPPVIQPAEINDPLVDYGTGCPFPVSSGDYAVGIQLVGDASCAKGGGVGCFQDVCRFCKFQETPQSTHMVACSTLGWPRTVAPVAQPTDITEDPATECPYAVSSGDYAVGIQLVGDASCVTGGLGCYKNVCRFCQFQETPNSKHFVHCSDLGYPHNGATFTPSSLDEPTSTNCPYPASGGEVAAGIQLVGDSACAHGGLGCFKDVCRFCKVWSTPQSSGYASCDDLGYYFGSPADTVVPEPPSTGPSTKCPFPASDGDLAAGVMLVGDASCDKGGIGCFQNVCRFCQFVPTPQSNQFVTCASLGYNYPLPPIPTMPAPTSPPPPPTMPPPTTAPPPTPAPTAAPCPYAVSDGDFAVGIQLVGDATCASGGLGCYANVCRFCKFKETPQSANWLPCSNFYLPAPTTAVVVTETPAPTTPPPPPPPIVNMTCDSPLSQGDRDAGVGLVTDYSCLISGLGCIKGSVCRFCQVWATEKSSHLATCHSYGATLPTPDVTQPSAAPSQAPGVAVTSEAPAATSQAPPPLGQTPVAGSQNPSVVAPEPPVVAPAPAGDASAPPAVAPIPPVVAPVAPAAGGDTVASDTSQTPSVVAPVAPAAGAAPVDPNSQAPPVVATAPSVVAPSPSDTTQAPAVAAPAVVPVAAPAVAPVPATQPSADPASVAPSQDPSAAPIVAPPPLRAAAKERASKSSAGTLTKLFENDAFKVSVAIAACVGVVALVALVAIGVKRALPRRKLRMPVVEEEETEGLPVVDDEEEETKEEEPETPAPATPTGVLEDQV